MSKGRDRLNYPSENRLPPAYRNALERMGPRSRQIALFYLENPGSTMTFIGEKHGLSPQRVSQIIHSNRFLSALARGARSTLRRVVPEATQVICELLKAKSEDVRLRTALRVLEENKLVGPMAENLIPPFNRRGRQMTEEELTEALAPYSVKPQSGVPTSNGRLPS